MMTRREIDGKMVITEFKGQFRYDPVSRRVYWGDRDMGVRCTSNSPKLFGQLPSDVGIFEMSDNLFFLMDAGDIG